MLPWSPSGPEEGVGGKEVEEVKKVAEEQEKVEEKVEQAGKGVEEKMEQAGKVEEEGEHVEEAKKMEVERVKQEEEKLEQVVEKKVKMEEVGDCCRRGRCDQQDEGWILENESLWSEKAPPDSPQTVRLHPYTPLAPEYRQPPKGSTPSQPASILERRPAPWDPEYDVVKVVGQVPPLGQGSSFSCRTLPHPSFAPLYEMLDPRSPLLLPPDRGALGSHGPRMDRGSHRPACGPAPPHHGPGGEGGIPVLSRHELFMSDPLLPPGQRIMLHVNQPPQPRGSLRLRTPPPIMACRVTPPPTARPPTWLSGPELGALTGLLELDGQAGPGAVPPLTTSPSLTTSHSSPDPTDTRSGGDQSA